jgi:hypothetical protein
MDPDDLLAGRRDVLADMIGTDRQLTMAAVDQHGQTDRLRSPEVDEGVHRGADRPARVQHVVDENDGPPIDAEREIRAFDDWLLRDEREVVAVEGDVECTDRDVDRFVLGDRFRDAAGQWDASTLDTDQQQA